MTLATGSRLGPYEILAPLGAGGMGEVYRARDPRMGREVAIKLCAASFSDRFEREVRAVAALNHSNICQVYDVGPNYLVLELVEGHTLAERIKSGPIPLDEALVIARQIGDALEAAHEKGIIHRDLKPANIKIKPDGTVKVLDFGLAKMTEQAAAGNSDESPTVTMGPTIVGQVMGTAAYMAPEQARGQPVDKRADIWAWGVVLWEMLTGRRLFAGETPSDILVAVITQEPAWERVPPKAQLLVKSCLEKDPKRRLRDIGDAWCLLEVAQTPDGHKRSVLPWVVAALLAIAVVVIAWWPARQVLLPITRATITIPSADVLAVGAQPAMAFSPDGNRLVYAAARGGHTRLYLRRMDQFDATPIPGTEEGGGPFFSPDGEWVGFFASGKLKKVSLNGGLPVVLCEAPGGRGGTWGEDGSIVFTPSNPPGFGLSRIPESGGTPQVLTTLDHKKGEASHRWPQFLPGGKAVLFSIWYGAGFDNNTTSLLVPATGERRDLITGGTAPQYAAGHLLFARAGELMAVPFDLASLKVTGVPFLAAQGIAMSGNTGAAHYYIPRSGALAYLPGGPRGGEQMLMAVDRNGTSRPLTSLRRLYQYPQISPDGRRVAVQVTEPNRRDVWIYELARDTLTRLTVQGTNSYRPIWSPDGKRIAFVANISGPHGLFWKPADFSGADEALTTSSGFPSPSSFSPDGKWLAFQQHSPSTSSDLWVLPMQGERKPWAFLQTPFSEWGAEFSPDGRWLAYVSNDSGREEVYVQPFPGPGARLPISNDGGAEPLWSRNGREMFYRNGDKMMAVDVTLQPSLAAGKPRPLFEGQYHVSAGFRSFDVFPDGRFLMIKSDQESVPMQINVVQNWVAELERRAGGGKK